MQRQYKDKAIKSADNKKVEEKFFFPPQDGFLEFNCTAESLAEAEEKYKEFKESKK